MAKYNVMLLQDMEDLVSYLERPLWEILAKFDPTEYRDARAVYEWLIREHIQSTQHLVCIEHYPRAAVYHRIRHRLQQKLGVTLEALMFGYVQCPKIYDDNIFIQVDLMPPHWDLYIQYYRHGRISDTKL